MRVGVRRHRFEFRLRDDEGLDTYPDLAAVRPLLAPWLSDDDGRRGVEAAADVDPVADLELVRLAVYTFRARLAERWRRGRVFLLGDAAHLTPPFIGQGVGAGLRDAANLAWKVAGVLDGSLPPEVLDSYEAERRPHARSMIRLARLVGALMTAGGRPGDVSRRLLAPRLHHVPGLRRRALDSTTPALRRSRLVRPAGLVTSSFGRRLAGSLCPNVVLPGGNRFDDVVGAAFAVVTVGEPSVAERGAIVRRGAVSIGCEPGSELGAWLRRGRARAAVVRPDRVVMQAGRDLSALLEAVPVAVGGEAGAVSRRGGRC
jgi:3-(3-hydroxy-phenyl)propionate hydroxylase